MNCPEKFFVGCVSRTIDLFRKVFGGTGILPVRVHRLKTCATNSGGRGRPPYQPFHALWVGQRPIRNSCFSPIFDKAAGVAVGAGLKPAQAKRP
jgi:hypothetical protein